MKLTQRGRRELIEKLFSVMVAGREQRDGGLQTVAPQQLVTSCGGEKKLIEGNDCKAVIAIFRVQRGSRPPQGIYCQAGGLYSELQHVTATILFKYYYCDEHKTEYTIKMTWNDFPSAVLLGIQVVVGVILRRYLGGSRCFGET